MTTIADKIRALEIPADLTDDEASGYWLAREHAAKLVEAEPLQAVRAKPDWDYFQGLVNIARRSAEKAKIKFPQPNYVTLKIAEEAGEVVRGAVHYAEGRMEWDEVQGEIVQLLAMLIRFVTEGDEVNGVKPPALVTLTPTAVDASPASDPVSKLDSWQSWIDDLPLPADFDEGKAGLQEYLAEALSIIHQMQDALIWCSAAADFAPEGQAREGWLKLCKPLIDRLPVDPVSKMPTLDALAMQMAAMAACTAELRNTARLLSNPPQSSAAWDARNAIDAITLPADAALAEAMRLPEVKERLEDDVTHSDDVAVNRFARAMKAKLAQARATGRSGWDDPAQCSEAYLAKQLVAHLGKGNPGTFEDVANFAMMLHQRGANPRVLKQATETQSYSEMLAEAMQLPEVKALVEAAEAVIRDFHGDNAIGVAHLTKLRAALKGVK